MQPVSPARRQSANTILCFGSTALVHRQCGESPIGAVAQCGLMLESPVLKTGNAFRILDYTFQTLDVLNLLDFGLWSFQTLILDFGCWILESLDCDSC